MKKHLFSKSIINWYLSSKRDLPWRGIKDPYKIWLSEIILQQTRVNQGLPYYQRFIDQYPTVQSLAAVELVDVLKLWEGLGYYTRAKNLHQCAKIIIDKYNGFFPKKYADLLTLPGIGTYTAAAIASFAYKEPIAVLDGNVYRVLSRVFGISDDISQSRTAKIFSKLANELLDTKQADIYNQAIMEFGAILCMPKKPLCNQCVISASCLAFKYNSQGKFPVKTKKVKVRSIYFYYIVYELENRYAMKQRNNMGIWNGLYDFPLIESDQHLTTETVLSIADIKGIVKNVSEKYKHQLTHKSINATFYHVAVFSEDSVASKEDLKWYTLDEIKNLPKPVLISKYLSKGHLH